MGRNLWEEKIVFSVCIVVSGASGPQNQKIPDPLRDQGRIRPCAGPVVPPWFAEPERGSAFIGVL